jgi:hypothetical protein
MAETFGAHRAWTLRFSTGFFAAMNPKNRNALAQRVVKAAEAALAAQGYASSIDVLVGIGWLDGGKMEQWRRGQIDYLERAVQTNLPRISEAMKLFRSWRPEEACPRARRVISRAARGVRRCVSAEAVTQRSKRCTGPIGYRKSFPSGNANAWQGKQAVPRIWWWSTH